MSQKQWLLLSVTLQISHFAEKKNKYLVEILESKGPNKDFYGISLQSLMLNLY